MAEKETPDMKVLRLLSEEMEKMHQEDYILRSEAARSVLRRLAYVMLETPPETVARMEKLFTGHHRRTS